MAEKRDDYRETGRQSRNGTTIVHDIFDILQSRNDYLTDILLINLTEINENFGEVN